jgi:Fe-Mn family superoxide dismutase
MAFAVPDLPYDYAALEPWIDEETMHLHHDKHHAAYASNLEKALEGTEYASWPVEKLLASIPSLPENLRGPVRNNGGGHFNHSLFWTIMAPASGLVPKGDLAAAIDRDLGGFEGFKEKLTKAAMGRFGSGWGWLVVKKDKKLEVTSTANQDSPLSDGDVPILGIDVWEHAYYVKYRNRRAEYVENFFKVINWPEVQRRYAEAIRA